MVRNRILSLFFALAVTANGQALLPVDRSNHAEYRKLIADKLLASNFDFGRVVVAPSFEPEYSVSVHSNERSEKAFVTSVFADANLWQVTDGGRLPQQAKTVRTQRIDAELPMRTAQLLRQAWEGMLTYQVKGREARGTRGSIVTDGTNFEFSLPRGNAVLMGEMGQFAPLGKKLSTMKILTKDLVNYSKQAPKQRPKIQRTIEMHAESLLNTLRANQAM